MSNLAVVSKAFNFVLFCHRKKSLEKGIFKRINLFSQQDMVKTQREITEGEITLSQIETDMCLMTNILLVFFFWFFFCEWQQSVLRGSWIHKITTSQDHFKLCACV